MTTFQHLITEPPMLAVNDLFKYPIEDLSVNLTCTYFQFKQQPNSHLHSLRRPPQHRTARNPEWTSTK